MPEPSTVATSALKAAGAVAKFRPWATVRRHNQLILEEYEDLHTWIRDAVQ